jgi:predicted ATPase/DNA-binding SARP family transcriptional activator
MEFRLLGPLEVCHEGRPLALGGPKQRALLAILLIHANQAVSTDRLIDDLWGEKPPDTADNTLQVYVANLRKLLQPDRPRGARSDVLLTRPPGYLLRVGDDEFNVLRFQALVEDGRRSLDADPRVAAARLRAGLALCRGPALADFAFEPFAAAEATRLEELRMSALENRIDADLALGAHAAVVAELEGLVTVHPLRERLRAQLMLALYRCGRQAEACRVYDAARAALVEDMGIDPGPHLQGLLKAILNHDPALAAPRPSSSHVMPSAGGPADSAVHNLPVELTSFIGRECELEEVNRLLRSRRLVTLTGAGGSGKTRLALRVAADVLGDYPAGVWLVELAPLADPGLVPRAVGAALGIREEPGRTMTEALVERLPAQRLLLLLDNCEHLVEPCAELAHALLSAGTELRILATSREALNVPGELAWRVPPLSLPEPDTTSPPAALADYAAIRLYVERAAAVRPGFVLDYDNAGAVTAICRRLDGIPLAIELAAARVRTMSPQEILQRLDHSFELLTGGARTARPRQQTLRATVDWSHDLLSLSEQVLFRRLAVFAGGFGLADAERVCADQELADGAVLDLLDHLVDKSLVLAEPGAAGSTRYRLLETLREYASERLQAAGEEVALRSRHLAHFLDLVEATHQHKMVSGSDAGLPVLTLNQDNLRAALGWGREADALRTLRMSTGLLDFWLSNDLAEGRRWLEESLAQVTERTPERARGLLAAGALANVQRLYDEARRYLEESLAISVELGDRRGEAWARTTLGQLCWAIEDHGGGRAQLERSIPMHEELGDRFGLARALIHLGSALSIPGGDAEGRCHLERGVAMAEELGDRWGMAYGLMLLGFAEIEAGKGASAGLRFRDALNLRVGGFMAGPLEGLAHLVAEESAERAMRLLGAAMEIRDRFGGRRPPVMDRVIEPIRGRAERHLEPDLARRAWDEGHQMTTEEALAFALEDEGFSAASAS